MAAGRGGGALVSRQKVRTAHVRGRRDSYSGSHRPNHWGTRMKLPNPLPRSFMDLLRLDAGMSLQKLTSLIVATALLAGCAADASKPTLLARQEATRSAAKVELIYNEEDQLIVTDGGGSGLTGFAGLLLGPIGALLALSIDTNSRMTMAARTDQRSKEFTAAVR